MLREDGRVILFKLVQLLKAEKPIYVTELGIEIFVNWEQNPKALSGIEVTESGIVTLVTAELWKAAWSIIVTGLPL